LERKAKGSSSSLKLYAFSAVSETPLPLTSLHSWTQSNSTINAIKAFGARERRQKVPSICLEGLLISTVFGLASLGKRVTKRI